MLPRFVWVRESEFAAHTFWESGRRQRPRKRWCASLHFFRRWSAGSTLSGDRVSSSSERQRTRRFRGLGTMGHFMAANLARAGFPLTVWNRTPSRADDVLALGATLAQSPTEVGRNSDIVIACLTDSPQVEEVLFGPHGSRRRPRCRQPLHRLFDAQSPQSTRVRRATRSRRRSHAGRTRFGRF